MEYENLNINRKPNIKIKEETKINFGRIIPIIDEDRFFVGTLRAYQKDKDLSDLALTRNFGDYFASIARTILIPEIRKILSLLLINSLFWQMIGYLNILVVKKWVIYS